MPGFTTYSGKIVVYNEHNVDTDRIIPARFLTMVTRSGYGELLFNDVRSADFPLDRPEAKGGTILVTGTNFGCGSSREHAVWAIQQAGFVAVISRKTDDSPGYSDIFRQNSANCGLLLIELEEAAHQWLVDAKTGAEVALDLPNQTVTCNGNVAKFEIAESTKQQLIAGLDLIGTTLQYADDIDRYESRNLMFSPGRQ